LKVKLANLPRRSKQWWCICQELLHKKTRIYCIPSLRDGASWLDDAKNKADVFAKKFAEKAELPQEVVDTPFFSVPDVEFSDFVVFRFRSTKRLMSTLKKQYMTCMRSIYPTHHMK